MLPEFAPAVVRAGYGFDAGDEDFLLVVENLSGDNSCKIFPATYTGAILPFPQQYPKYRRWKNIFGNCRKSLPDQK
jgi:hypothetical protein